MPWIAATAVTLAPTAWLFEAAAHRPGRPAIQKTSGPLDPGVVPEMIGALLQIPRFEPVPPLGGQRGHPITTGAGDSYSFQMSAVRALRSGMGGSFALGTGSYQKVAQDQSSRVSARPSFQAICWIVMRTFWRQPTGSGRCRRYMVTKSLSLRLHPL